MSSTSLLGSKIEAARKELRFSQAKLAEMVGVSRASISLYETGEGAPSYKVLTKLSSALGLALPTLAGLVDSVDYKESIASKESFNEVNIIRSQLIKEVLEIEEKYIEIDFLSPRIVTRDAAGDLLLSQKEIDELKATGVLDFTFGNDPTREININFRWPTASVLVMPEVDYTDAGIFIVKDNKMGVRYPQGSRHVVLPIKERKQWKYLTGLHGFFIQGIGGYLLMIRRIIINKSDRLELADSDGNIITVMWEDVTMVWKVGQTIHMPPEK